jgi:cytochrome o ubiquinol oxidase subunit 1
MPRNTGVGVTIGAITFIFGFAMVWHIWWMATGSAVAMLAVVVMRANDEDVDYMVSAEEVAHLETRGMIPTELRIQG